ncbi:protein of unknown function [Paraburkholderia kururiensis]
MTKAKATGATGNAPVSPVAVSRQMRLQMCSQVHWLMSGQRRGPAGSARNADANRLRP